MILSNNETLYKDDISIKVLSTDFNALKKEAYIIGKSIIDPTKTGDSDAGNHIKVTNIIDIVGIDFSIFIIGLINNSMKSNI